MAQDYIINVKYKIDHFTLIYVTFTTDWLEINIETSFSQQLHETFPSITKKQQATH